MAMVFIWRQIVLTFLFFQFFLPVLRKFLDEFFTHQNQTEKQL